eukprot:754898-Hanusia_phi.AAC.9
MVIAMCGRRWSHPASDGDDREIFIEEEMRTDASGQSKSCQRLFKQISDGLSNQKSLVLAGSCACEVLAGMRTH